MRSLLALTIAVLALPAAAHAGGWASTDLSSSPSGAVAGKPWKVDVTIKQHGQTPVAGLKPAIILRGPGGTRRFAAAATATTGVYRANVTFPQAGAWKVHIDNGMFGEQLYGSYDIPAAAPAPAAAGPSSPADDGGPSLPLLLGLGAAGVLAALGATTLVRRRGRAVGA